VVAYLLGLAFSLDLGVIKDTFHLLPAAIAYGTLVALVCGMLMLALSSLSRNSRYVGICWVGLWLVGFALSNVMTNEVRAEWGPLLSFDGNLKRVGDALLDLESARQKFESLTQFSRQGARPPGPPSYQEPLPDPPWTWSAAVLLGLMGLSLWILASRVKSLDRLK
jgi:hypothetical protein